MPELVRRSLPNSLTMLRLVLAGVFFGTLNVYRFDAEVQHAVWANVAVGVFILATITDILDGYLARRWRVVSVFGRIMDPFCDKVLILGGFIYLAGPRFAVSEWAEKGDFITMATGVYPWMVVVMLGRELLVTGFRGEAESTGESFASAWSGKVKMVLQSITIPLVIFLVVNLNTVEILWARWACYVAVYLTVGMTILSGLPYLGRLRHLHLRRPPVEDPTG